MYKQITLEDIMESEEITLYNNEVLYVAADGNGKMYGIIKGQNRWFQKTNYWNYYNSAMELDYLDTLSADEALALLRKWGYSIREKRMEAYEINNLILEDAMRLAINLHEGQVRKDTHTPFTFHLLETMGILRGMNADINVQVAGVLHDSIEYTKTTYAEICHQFGKDVVSLIDAQSSYKNEILQEEKTALIAMDERVQMLVMAESVSELRQLVATCEFNGESLWERFNPVMKKMSLFYSKILDDTCDMQNRKNTAPIYQEMMRLYKDVFVNYFWRFPDADGSGEALFQIAAHGKCIRLERGTTQWKLSNIPDKETVIGVFPRESAEELENEWNASSHGS